MAAPEDYLRLAYELGVEIKYVIHTHVLADHLSTGRELADAAQAECVLMRAVAVACMPSPRKSPCRIHAA